jgi:pectin methylesterase-like acyl-CoA thioesterase
MEFQALSTAFQGLSGLLKCVESVAAYRAEQKRQRAFQIQGQQQFIHQFTYAAAPTDDAQEEETIRSYCRKLQSIIRSHWSFIFGRGAVSTEAAHAFMANTIFQIAAMSGVSSTPTAKPAMTGQAHFDVTKVQRI